MWRSLDTALLAERDRWNLWLPVLIGAGIAGYFSLAVEPPRWLGGTALAALALVVLYRRPGARVGLIAAVAVALGFALVQWRAHDVAAPVLARELGPAEISGRVVEVQAREHGVRLLLDQPSIAKLDPERTPARIRVTARTDRGGARAGDWVRIRAVLLPPPEPAAPGAFDRRAWFEGLGAVGYAVSAVTRIESPAAAQADFWPDFWPEFGPWLGRLRNDIAGRVREPLGAAAGGIAAALMAGDRGTIPPPDLAAMRDAGLAHLLAISGLHIGLFSGSLFFVVRGLLALWPAVALRYPIKKWAAVVTLVGAFGYLLVTGATVPTQRAFLMTGLVLSAVMLDRLAFSMALVAWAAALVLVLAPDSLLGPSFQMSFAAVVALIAVYEGLRERLVAWRRGAGTARRLGLYLMGVGLTTLVVGLATAPFAAFHFDRGVGYGLIANLGAVPITALWIMPWALAAYALMPFGLEAVALAPMGWGIEAVLRIAHGVRRGPARCTPCRRCRLPGWSPSHWAGCVCVCGAGAGVCWGCR